MGEKRTHRFLSVVGVPSILWETEAILAGHLRILSPIGAVDDESIVSCLLTQRLVQHKLLSRRQRWLEKLPPNHLPHLGWYLLQSCSSVLYSETAFLSTMRDQPHREDGPADLAVRASRDRKVDGTEQDSVDELRLDVAHAKRKGGIGVKRRNGAGSVLVTVGLAKSGMAGCWGWVECSAVECVQANGRGMWRKERDEDGEDSGPHPARGGCASSAPRAGSVLPD